MKISKIVVMKDLDTGENKEVKLDTKEVREFNFPKKAYFINKVFIDNMWLKIALIIWFLILIVLLIFEKISQNYNLLSVLIFASLTTITLAANFDIIKLYFLGDILFGNSIKKRSIIKWSWKYTEKVETPYTELEEKTYNFLEKAFKEINKFAIRFYLSHLIAVLALSFIIVLLIIENQPDERASIFVVGIWIFTEFYLWIIRCFIRAKAEENYSIDLIDDDSTKESAVLEVNFSLNGNYIIEE